MKEELIFLKIVMEILFLTIVQTRMIMEYILLISLQINAIITLFLIIL